MRQAATLVPHARLKSITLVIALMVGLPIVLMTGTAQAATPLPVPLGSADTFAILAGTTITNTGPSTVNGDVGLHPGSAVTGFGPCPAAGCVTLNGNLHVADNVALAAKSDLVTAYNNAAGRTPPTTILTQLGGQTLPPGVYNSSSGTFNITGNLILDGGGDPASVFIFQTASTLVTAAGAPALPASSVTLINSADACHVYWQVGSSATIGTYSNFAGTILALTATSVQTGATVNGRTLARNAAVTMDTNTIGSSACPSPSTPPAPPPGSIDVSKTHQFKGSRAVSTNAKWVFTLRNAAGTALQCTHPNPSNPAKCTTNLNHNGPVLHYLALPADTYTLCEKAFRSWHTQFRSRPAGSSVSGRCITFPLAAGQNLTTANGTQLRVNNLCVSQ